MYVLIKLTQLLMILCVGNVWQTLLCWLFIFLILYLDLFSFPLKKSLTPSLSPPLPLIIDLKFSNYSFNSVSKHYLEIRKYLFCKLTLYIQFLILLLPYCNSVGYVALPAVLSLTQVWLPLLYPFFQKELLVLFILFLPFHRF